MSLVNIMMVAHSMEGASSTRFWCEMGPVERIEKKMTREGKVTV